MYPKMTIETAKKDKTRRSDGGTKAGRDNKGGGMKAGRDNKGGGMKA